METKKFNFTALIFGVFCAILTIYILGSILYPNSADTIMHFLQYYANESTTSPTNRQTDEFNISALPEEEVSYSKTPPIKIGLLILATGKYANFTLGVVETGRTYMMSEYRKNKTKDMPTYEMRYFIFTDHFEIIAKGPDVTHIFQRRIGWPGDVLWRNEVYLNSSARLVEMGMDYLFSFDADFLFEGDVGPEILGDLVGTNHPCYYQRPRVDYPYEAGGGSCATIQYNEGKYYFYGGLFGGRTEYFFELCRWTMQCTHSDANKHMMARVMDESYLNRYFVDHPPTLVLDPGYCTPQLATLPFRRRIISLEKDQGKMRSSE